MQTINKEILSVSTAVLIGTLTFAALYLVYQEDFSQVKSDIRNKEKNLIHYKSLVMQKETTEKEWNKNQIYFKSGSADLELNGWVKELIAKAQNHSIVFEKLEPRGRKKTGSGEEVGVFVSFEGDARKFIRFLYDLYEKDPMAKVESFLIDQSKERGKFSYELTLTKMLTGSK